MTIGASIDKLSIGPSKLTFSKFSLILISVGYESTNLMLSMVLSLLSSVSLRFSILTDPGCPY